MVSLLGTTRTTTAVAAAVIAAATSLAMIVWLQLKLYAASTYCVVAQLKASLSPARMVVVILRSPKTYTYFLFSVFRPK